jgi:Protein of unknown function (DUF1552)
MTTISRRHMLKASAVTLALPWMESLARGNSKLDPPPRRMVCICSPLGIHAEHFFPKEPGRDYTLTPYLKELENYREQFTVISGLAHPDVGPSHDSMASFLTGAPHPENRAGFRNSVSLDQFAAARLRGNTRYDSLTFGVEGAGLAWTPSGAPVPAAFLPSRVFKQLFIEGTPEEVRAEMNRLRGGRSILDALTEQRSKVRRELAPHDQEKFDEYLTSVRELEIQLTQSVDWQGKPKPKVNVEPPTDVANQADILQQDKVWYDLIYLALQTDSTRLITLTLSGLTGVPLVDGVSLGYHDLSHHGQDQMKLDQLRKVEQSKMAALNLLLKRLHETTEGDATLLDRCMIFYSSNLGNASNHDVKNLPILLAGGGFRHGKHLSFDADKGPPLCNLYVSMLQQLGLEIDRFSSSTGTLNGLETS